LVQTAILVRNPDLKKEGVPFLPMVYTWSAKAIVGTAGYINNIRNTIKDQMDKFINAYLSVNPK